MKKIARGFQEPMPLIITPYILYMRYPESLLTNGLKDFNKTWYILVTIERYDPASLIKIAERT